MCIDANGDMAGDGISNDKDFCEHMAGGANNEDGEASATSATRARSHRHRRRPSPTATR